MKPGAWELRDTATGRTVVEELYIADSSVERARGLLWHPELMPQEGLFLSPCSGIHTFFMRYPIDVVFLNEQLSIIRMVGHLKSWRCCGPIRNCRTVLELPAGTIERLALRTGMRLELVSWRRE